jgi:hypothetical protein
MKEGELIESNRVGRREVLMGAGVGALTLAAVALPATAASADDEGGGRLEGGWLITHSNPAPPGPASVQAS